MEAMTVREWAKSGFSPLAHARGSETALAEFHPMFTTKWLPGMLPSRARSD